MELGLKGKWAIVCGASKGLGYACAHQLAQEGVNVVLVARTDQTLQDSAQQIRDETGAHVIAVAADIASAAGREQVLAAAPQVDILVNNAGGPPPGDFRDFSREDWLAALDANMLAPIEMIKATVDAMIARRFGRIVNITSMAVKAPVDILCLSNGARAGLTGFTAGLSRQVVQHNVTINNLLPGKFDTARLRANNTRRAQATGVALDEAIIQQKAAIPAGRFGEAPEFGHACAFLCSAHSGYITGQNLLIDGGVYHGLL